ncbi:MAG: pilin [Minisyncoccia bacterium]
MNIVQFRDLLLFIVDAVISPLIFAAAFVVFIWGVYTYFIAGAANEEKRKEGRTFVMYGLIGFFVIVSVWGIVRLLTGTFRFEGVQRPETPRFGPPSGATQSPRTGGAP